MGLEGRHSFQFHRHQCVLVAGAQARSLGSYPFLPMSDTPSLSCTPGGQPQRRPSVQGRDHPCSKDGGRAAGWWGKRSSRQLQAVGVLIHVFQDGGNEGHSPPSAVDPRVTLGCLLASSLTQIVSDDSTFKAAERRLEAFQRHPSVPMTRNSQADFSKLPRGTPVAAQARGRPWLACPALLSFPW